MIDPVTLGEVLAARQSVLKTQPSKGRSFLVRALKIIVLTALTLLPLWWLIERPQNSVVLVGVGVGLIGVWIGLAWLGGSRRAAQPAQHFLLDGDQQRFMADLRLDQKTAVIDGNNLYHFGLKEGLGARALHLIAKHLREEGYRIVCFFDANIFYTLMEHETFAEKPSHTIYLLTQIFGLEYSEIYIVPSRVQADKYILSTMKHLPTSFAVTNDRFRDYGKAYPDVMSGDQWRKGVVVDGNELRLLKFRFQTPIRLNTR